MGLCTECSFAEQEGHAYLFCTEARTWSEARSFCNERGYRLVAIDSADENQWIFAWADAQLNIDRWFIGISDEATEDQWLLDDGSAPAYTNFHEMVEPNGGQNENCGAMGFQDYGPTWDDQPCATSYPFVCEAGGG